uniref:Uncharacterized protein n=1 Tax=viral metagenome TaxID=1070528 RepID=A0A6C0H9F9_9ZZZZ
MVNNEIYNELINKQLINIYEYKLSHSDLLRIANKLNNSIFTNECSIYQGNIIIKNNKKYIPFFYNYKQISLTRILFHNFIKCISKNIHLTYICNNKGCCCSLNHMKLNKKSLNRLNSIPQSIYISHITPNINLNTNQIYNSINTIQNTNQIINQDSIIINSNLNTIHDINQMSNINLNINQISNTFLIANQNPINYNRNDFIVIF